MRKADITGRELGVLRRRSGMTQTELAAKMEVSQAAVYAWETGKRTIPRHRERVINEILTSLKGSREV